MHRKTYTQVAYKENLKRCTRCLGYKEFKEFHKRSNSADGYAPSCKSCLSDVHKKIYDSKRVKPVKKLGDQIHCRRCEKYLPEESFGRSKTYCKSCWSDLGHTNNINKYGLDRDTYVDLEKEQNGVCKICGEKEIYNKRLSIDHDHTCCEVGKSCGKCIRGLLCSRCNKALGMINDDIVLLQKMIDYLS